MAQKERVIFRRSGQTKTTINNEPAGVFQFCFSCGKLRDSSLTYFTVFVVFYLEIVENIDEMHKSTFSITT